MINATVINKASEHLGKVVKVTSDEWSSGKFWIEVELNGRKQLMARHHLD